MHMEELKTELLHDGDHRWIGTMLHLKKSKQASDWLETLNTS